MLKQKISKKKFYIFLFSYVSYSIHKYSYCRPCLTKPIDITIIKYGIAINNPNHGWVEVKNYIEKSKYNCTNYIN